MVLNKLSHFISGVQTSKKIEIDYPLLNIPTIHYKMSESYCYKNGRVIVGVNDTVLGEYLNLLASRTVQIHILGYLADKDILKDYGDEDDRYFDEEFDDDFVVEFAKEEERVREHGRVSEWGFIDY